MNEARTARQGAFSEREAASRSGAARLSILTASFLIILKTAAGLLTGSISVWASLLDSAMDVLASLINFIAVRAASLPPDEDHRYGHGKAESLAGLFQAAVITISGLFLVREAIIRILNPKQIEQEWIGIGVMVVSSLLSAVLVVRLKRVARETDSLALEADSLHYASDVYANAAALAALLVVRLSGWKLADPLFSLAISAYILFSAFQVGRNAINVLMDRRLPREIDAKVANIIERFKNEGVIGFHDLRTRRSGAYKFIDMHLEVEREKSLEEAHNITVKVINSIQKEIPRSRVHIHTDPAG